MNKFCSKVDRTSHLLGKEKSLYKFCGDLCKSGPGRFASEKSFDSNLPIKLSLVINKRKHFGFWKYVKKISLRALKINKAANGPFFTSRHRKFQKLTISLLVTHYMQQEIVCTPKFCDIQGVWKAFQFWYVSFQRLVIIYLKHPSDSFLKSVKSILFLSWVDISLSPDHTIENSGWLLLIRCSKA